MKRVLEFWNSKYKRPFYEKEIREELGVKAFNAMVQEATEAMNQKGDIYYFFPYDSPYFGWSIEDKAGRNRHKYGIVAFTFLVCTAMFVIGLQCTPPQWVQITFACLAGVVGLVGFILKIKAIDDTNCWLRDISNPLLIGGLLMAMGLTLLK